MHDLFLTAWIASVPGVGPRWCARLRERYPSGQPLLRLPVSRLRADGIPEKLACAIVHHRVTHPVTEVAKLCEKHHVTLVVTGDADYPPLLRQIHDPPVVLYVQGKLPSASTPSLAVVGTRRMTRYGEDVTRTFTEALVHAGFVIVSGFMYGVDACAHRAALHCGGNTIGVLGFGFDHMYPPEHRDLASRMLSTGNCLLTEFAPWIPAVPGNFPSRNRIVSGMCLGVLVTEAASKSGSKITAQCAVDQGREVFAVPGPIHSPFSEGTKELINMGAKLASNVDDILEEFGIVSSVSLPSCTPPTFKSSTEAKIYERLSMLSEASFEELLEYTGADARGLTQTLSAMELAQYIEMSQYGTYKRKS